jgi:molybdate transport system substrate-binding protein
MVVVALTTVILCSFVFAQDSVMVFSGAAFKKPLDEISSLYEKKTATKVYVTYGAVKTIMSQVMLAKKGDVFVVPSPDIMEKMVEKEVVKKDSIKNFSYQVPVILVHKGNPKKIKGLKDLLRDDVRVAIANPETVYIGMLTAEIFDKHFTASEREALKKKLVTYADDISKLLSYLVMNQADAIVGFDFLLGWHPDKIEVIKLNSNEIVRIGIGQIGLISYSTDSAKAKRFIDFVLSEDGLDVFKKYGYLSTDKDAFNYVGKKAPVGGTPMVSKGWLKK